MISMFSQAFCVYLLMLCNSPVSVLGVFLSFLYVLYFTSHQLPLMFNFAV